METKRRKREKREKKERKTAEREGEAEIVCAELRIN